MLDQETIRTFIQVASLGSFSQAAKNLYKTPAAISYRIKALENNLGVELFKRTTRTVALTDAGNYLFERCQQWVHWLDNMPSELKQINNGVEPEINIVINNLLYNELYVADLLSYLKNSYPFTQIKIYPHVYMGVWDKLLHGDIQLAIGVSGWETLDSAINLLPLGQLNWEFVISPKHPLAHINHALNDEQLRCYPAINVEDTSENLIKRIAWLLPGQMEITVPNLATKLACHIKGLGIGFLPINLAAPYIKEGSLIKCAVVNPRNPSKFSLAWRRDNIGRVTLELISLFKKNHLIAKGFLRNIDEPLN